MTIVAWGANAVGELGAGLRTPVQSAPITAGSVPVDVRWAMSTYESGAAVQADGSVLSWGGNMNGQLGDGTRFNKYNPVRAHLQQPVKQLQLAGAHAIALLEDNTVATWGSNTFGTLGNGISGEGKEGFGSPVPVSLKLQADSVWTGGAACFAVQGGTVLSWGENKSGQLGQGDFVERKVPTLIAGLENVVKIAAGGMTSVSGHALAVHADGTVSAWGANGQGQCGIENAKHQLSPVPLNLPFLVRDVACGVSHTVFLSVDGRVFTVGGNEFGELGTGTPQTATWVPQEVTLLPTCDRVDASYRHSHALCGGVLYSWGWNRYGTLGFAGPEVVPTPQAVSLPPVKWVVAGERQGMASIDGEGPAAPVRVSQGAPGTLKLDWEFPASANKWWLNWREKVNPAVPWTRIVSGPGGLPASTRSYLVAGLKSGVPAEIKLQTHGPDLVNVLPATIVEAVPA